MYVGCRNGFVASNFFVCWLICDFVAQGSDLCFDFLYCNVVFDA